jgi:hypothetical protein
LQNFALAAALARLTLAPVDHAAAALAGGDEDNNPGASLTNSGVSCLRNSDSHKLRSQSAATAVSLINTGRPTANLPVM